MPMPVLLCCHNGSKRASGHVNKQNRKIETMSALTLVKKQFPRVKYVKDATKPIRVSVTAKDSQEGRKMKPNDCALARACRRELRADGAIINVSVSYIIKGDTAIRYKTSGTVAREITSFDRNAGFQPGNDYLLSAVSDSQRLGVKDHGDTSGPHTKPKPHLRVHHHRTENIRIFER